MNTKLLLEVKERILAEPEHFNMDDFYAENPHDCGTAACIGGWIVALGLKEKPNVEFYLKFETGISTKALELLEVPNYQSYDDLFYVNYWPWKFKLAYLEAKDSKDFKEQAIIAAQVIDDYIATEGWQK